MPTPTRDTDKPKPTHRPRPRKGELLVMPSGRTTEGRRLREFRDALILHVGTPSMPQLVLIDRCTMLQRHLSRLDTRAAAEGLSEFTMRQYISWQNCLTRALRELGMQGAPPRVPTIDELIARPAPEDAP